MSDLKKWWQDTSNGELDSLLPKMVEYSSHDLEIMGQTLLDLRPELRGQVNPAEIAIAFYAFGKMARIMGAYTDGVRPSDDSWHDLSIYARMAQRVREAGTWPGEVKK